MTALDLIKGAMRLIGAIAAGEEPEASEAQDALLSLNDLIDGWQNERLMTYAVLPQTFPFVANKKVYTMGPDGDFNTARPVRIDKVQLQYAQGGVTPTLNMPIEIIDIDQYNNLIVPDTTSPIPDRVYIDGGYPLRTLAFYTVPSVVNQIQIFSWQLLQSFANLTTAIALPPGYAKALRFNLAIDIAPEYGIEPSQTVVARAQEAKATIKSVNNTYTPKLRVDPALTIRRKVFNYMTGE